ncbi:Chaperone protein dnaJ 20 [Forsythia ovata]|uniref:Chaperone protein dnaJ 20 n=1 Tax=Forsythia ovata TaxID=205694 RepID=A0ABD1PVR3_9LAMI
MNIIQSSTLKSGTVFMPFSHSKSLSVHHKFKIVSCKTTLPSVKMAAINFHKELSVNASVDEIKRVYRKMALLYHPDVCDPSMAEESTRVFVELQKAYENLLDQDSKCRKERSKEASRDKWDIQLSELKRRYHKEGSWASRMRASHQHA